MPITHVLAKQQGGESENNSHLMPLGAGLIMRCRNELRGMFAVHPAPFLAERADLKVRRLLPPELVFTAAQMLDLLM